MNLGPSPATSADILDLLPAGLTFQSATPSQGTYDPATGVWTVGAIPVTVTEILSITAQVTTLGVLTNTATRQASTPVDPNPANDGATVVATPPLVADLALTKTPTGTPPFVAGAPLASPITVTNNGPPSHGRRSPMPSPTHRGDVDVHPPRARARRGGPAAIVDLPSGTSVASWPRASIIRRPGLIATTATVAAPAERRIPIRQATATGSAAGPIADLAIAKTALRASRRAA